MTTRLHLTTVQQLVSDLSQIERSHYHPATNRHETVAEHSLSVATLAWFLHQHVQSTTNLNLVIKYALAHDFVETRAGDTNTYASPAERAAKEVREQQALVQLDTELKAFPDLITTMRAYQTMTSPEARFVWTVDKIQALVCGRMDHWRPYRQLGITRAQFQAKNAQLLAQAAPELAETFANIIAWCNETYA